MAPLMGEEKNFFDFETFFLSVRSFGVKKIEFDLQWKSKKSGGVNNLC